MNYSKTLTFAAFVAALLAGCAAAEHRDASDERLEIEIALSAATADLEAARARIVELEATGQRVTEVAEQRHADALKRENELRARYQAAVDREKDAEKLAQAESALFGEWFGPRGTIAASIGGLLLNGFRRRRKRVIPGQFPGNSG